MGLLISHKRSITAGIVAGALAVSAAGLADRLPRDAAAWTVMGISVWLFLSGFWLADSGEASWNAFAGAALGFFLAIAAAAASTEEPAGTEKSSSRLPATGPWSNQSWPPERTRTPTSPHPTTCRSSWAPISAWKTDSISKAKAGWRPWPKTRANPW